MKNIKKSIILGLLLVNLGIGVIHGNTLDMTTAQATEYQDAIDKAYNDGYNGRTFIVKNNQKAYMESMRESYNAGALDSSKKEEINKLKMLYAAGIIVISSIISTIIVTLFRVKKYEK